MNTMNQELNRMANLIKRHYRPIWECSDRQRAFELCNDIRQKLGKSEYTYPTFDHGFQWRNIFNEDYRAAKEEFLNVVFGCW